MIDPNHPASQAQIAAATPYNSSWVSANAGSGKTRVLTDRVARLLLRGTAPSRVLCLTYTKAAASEMQNRLFKRLGEWAMMPDAELRAGLQELGEDGQAVEVAQLANARTLFARALETPGGLKIQTIHSFCELLLRRFPLESGVSPQFEVMEERQAAQLRRALLEEMAEQPDGSFVAIAGYLPANDPDPVLADILKHRAHFSDPPDTAKISRVLGVTGTPSYASCVADILAAVPAETVSALMETLDQMGGKNEKLALSALSQAWEHTDVKAAFQGLCVGFLKADHGIKTQHFPTKAVRENFPMAEEVLRQLSEATRTALEAMNAYEALQRSKALYRFARDFLDGYDVQKSALGKLDFDDLISRARNLLLNADAAAWVQYRLDGGIDHVLVDEAQDTSLVQWDVIDALASDFFSGDGARDVMRTIFVVGDEKQSIYSFQGADPAAFGAKKAHYAKALDEATIGLETCALNYSFRSATPVLSVVDEVFRRNDVHGLAEDINHEAFHAAKPGRVDLWPFIEKPDQPDEAPWHHPVDQPPSDDPALMLAKQLAGWVRERLDSGMALPGRERCISPGDFLILVRSRGKLFQAIIRELKAAQVPIGGADRLKVTAELAVRDLLAVLRFLATDTDDLSLAVALRSPLFSVSEAELYTLAHDRKGSLWQSLQDTQHEALNALNDLRDRADFLRPFELLERMLTRLGGRSRMVARLGGEAEDGIDALLDLALDYERVETPTLTGFLEWMDSDEVEIKRQFDSAADQVRVMTVHGAKGLEASIVILPDTHAPRGSAQSPPVMMAEGCALLRVAKPLMPDAMLAADEARKQLDREERWRLLYVAMTRAESWLVVCGGGAKGNPETGWYAAIEDAMTAMDVTETEAGLTLSTRWEDVPGTALPDENTATQLPDWANTPGPAVPEKIKVIAPSRDGGAAHALPGPGEDTETAMLHGRRLHLLLERFAELPAAEWAQSAQTMLSQSAEPANPDEIAKLVDEATQVLNAPDLAWVFDTIALCEVSIAGQVPALGFETLRGQIDRLLIGEDIWAVDFKSNRVVPKGIDEIPDGLIGQMALYHAALTAIWPDRVIRTGLIWTATATFTEIPQETVNSWLQSRPSA